MGLDRPIFVRRASLFVLLCGLSAGWCSLAARAQPAGYSQANLIREFEQFNASVNDGKGYSEYKSSASLAWGESYYLNAYIKMYRATGDTKWLDVVVDHVDRMIGNMSDHNGDRILSWHTDRYSPSSVRTFVLHNQGTATITPDEYREFNIDRAHEAVDGEYAVEFVGANRYEVRDLPGHRRIGSGTYTSGQPIEEIAGFDVIVSGSPVAGDKFRVETQAPGPLEYAVHEGMIAYPIAQFIELALRVDGLRARYSAKAESYLKLIENRILAKQERYWLDLAGGGGAYRATEAAWERYPNRVLPHNQYLALGRAYLVLQAVSDNPLFLTRATQMAKFFKANLHVTRDAYTWSYWNWVEAGEAESSSTEDTSHGHIDIEFAVEAWRRGVEFTDSDMRGFARTLTDLMWNGSFTDPTVGGRVDRTTGEGKTIRGWIELARWDARIWDLLWALFPKIGRPGREIPHLIHLRDVVYGQGGYLVEPRAATPPGPATPPAYSLSLDLDTAPGDQSVSSLAGASGDWPFTVQVHGGGLKDAVGIVVSFGYDDTQLSFEGFDNASVFPDLSVEVVANPATITLRSDTLATGLTADEATIGELRFRTQAQLASAAIWVASSSVQRPGHTETRGKGMEARLSALACDFDGSGEVGFADFLSLARGYGSRDGSQHYEARLDLDADGSIDFSDFLLFARTYGARMVSSG